MQAPALKQVVLVALLLRQLQRLLPPLLPVQVGLPQEGPDSRAGHSIQQGVWQVGLLRQVEQGRKEMR